jgi:hypothetical protein
MSNEIVKYEKPAMPSVGSAERMAAILVVEDQETYDVAMSTAAEWKAEREAWEAKRKSYADPVNVLKDMIQADFMPIIRGYDAAIAMAKAKGVTFLKAEEQKRLDAQAAADKAYRDAQVAAEAAAKKLEKKNPEAAEAVREAAQLMAATIVAPTVAQSSGNSAPKKWKGRVTDAQRFIAFVAANPAYSALLEIKQGDLDRMINASKGGLKFDGVENYQDVSITLRK